MKNTRWILCFDFETDSPDPYTCNPTELAAVPIHPETLEIKEDEIFSVNIKPPGIDKEDYFTTAREETIKWNTDKLKITYEEVVEKWKGGISPRIAWKNFCTYCKKYNVDKKKGQWYPEPLPAGFNIITFDLLIANRMSDQFKTKFPFSSLNKLDLYDNLFWWFENLDEPKDLKMDTLREFFGIKSRGLAHSAKADVLEEADLLVRFMQFHRKQARVDKFKGSMS